MSSRAFTAVRRAQLVLTLILVAMVTAALPAGTAAASGPSEAEIHAPLEEGPDFWINSVSRDLTGDGHGDIVAIFPNGLLRVYPLVYGAFQPSRDIGIGWGMMNDVSLVDDFSGDGVADIIARDGAGNLWMYRGDGTGGVTSGVRIGVQWQTFTALFSPGDFDGDGYTDLMARDTLGRLWLYSGNGAGGFLGVRQVGSGWNMMREIVGFGDYDLDGADDVLARTHEGVVYVYPGNGAGAWGTPSRIQYIHPTWFPDLVVVGDIDDDFIPDFYARRSDGVFLPHFSAVWPSDRPLAYGSGWSGLRLLD